MTGMWQMWVGVGLVLAGVGLLVVLSRRRARDRRDRRLRVASRRALSRRGAAGWPWAEPMPPLRGGVYRGGLYRSARGRGGGGRG